MKYIVVMCAVAMLAALNTALARPVLVAVELEDNGQIQHWLGLNHPTYEYLNRTAIAEVDESEVAYIAEDGFVCEVIDHAPWSERYFIAEVPEWLASKLTGKVIWQKQTISLIKVPESRERTLFSLPLNFQPLKRIPLSHRFWQQFFTRYVPMMSVEWDPFIQSIVDQVNTDSITAFIQRLQDFKTRFVLTDSSYAASEWLRQKFLDWGYATEFDSFYFVTGWPGSGYERNVIATAYGSEYPSKMFIIGGHFDAIVYIDDSVAFYNAPGADDNASGTVAAMEAARIFRNYTWKSTIQFIGWGAEERGLFGSYHYAQRADSLGQDVGGVMNLDMIGYMDDALLDCIIQRRDGAPLWLSNLYEQAGQLYVPSLIIYPVVAGGGSDWYPFAVYGYPAVGGAEAAVSHFNPYYHDTTDLLSTLSPQLFTAITQTSIATMAILGTYPIITENVAVRDMGDGEHLVVNWDAQSASDIIGYKVYYGRESESYTDTHYVADQSSTTDTLGGLMTDSTYYVAVTALDDDGHESYAAIEVTGVPRIMPLPPSDVTATPIIPGIRIDWAQNTELDVDGYRVYRRMNQDTLYDSLNTLLLKDTTFTNAPLSGEHKYYYTVRTFDTEGNYSPLSEEVYGRPITLDQGILIVDETRDGGGPNPSDSLQDAFYHSILDAYNYTEYEYGSSAEKPVFADFVPYSTLLWHADDYSQLLASDNVKDFADYLDIGGNLWFVGWKPTANLRSNIGYPVDFSPGSFMFDYLKISYVDLSTASDSFQAAIGHLGYPRLDVDSAKVLVSSWGGTMRMIEALTSVSSGEDIYTIDLVNNSSPFEGEVCGVRYLGPDYNVVFFGFPLYYMDHEQARVAAHKVMTDFGELAVAESPIESPQVSRLQLQQNRPNPSPGQTVIAYQIPHAGNVTLKIYNIIGQLVKTLVSERQSPGVYQVTWAGDDDRGRRVSNGVYFYQLQLDEQSRIQKMTLLR